MSASINTPRMASSLLNKLVLHSESLNNILDGRHALRDDLIRIYMDSRNDPTELFTASWELRKKFKKNIVTFSKKAFFNVINLCKDTCSYCTYKAEPTDAKLSLMSLHDVKSMLDIAKKYHCVEALFVTGEAPELKYSEAKKWLKSNGFTSTAEYLIHASEMALESGLFPHTNAGNLEKEDLRELQKTNASMGIMLENVSERLCNRGMPHYLAASKKPQARLKILKNTGRLKIPMTTGLLVGIGETPYEIIDSIIAIRNLHETFGNIQEVILQNFQPKPDTMMGNHAPADENYFRVIVALTRIAMPEMNIQVPPNLSPHTYGDFLHSGINDWGGVSPLTPDYVNPEFPWPEIDKIRENSAQYGFELKCRFPIYPEYFTFVSRKLRSMMGVIEDDKLVAEKYWK